MSMIGKTLGHYSVSTLIGRGGMGEVYKAKDQKLGRDVAIKVLPEEFAKDPDRVARFQREAKLLASLNHPNIAAIHGLEESDGTHFLVLELIEGDTLADRLKRCAIPVEESLKLVLQIAEALEAAHEKSVIHRDLKPANIKVTPDGKVKVLDFGLAKAYAGIPEDINLSNSPTLSNAATQQGVILGTAGYMSPEQARGESVDKRADIWAFGIVLFEMLTGRQVFSGKTVSDTLASVLAREPEWKSLPPNLHPRIRFLLERCLEKETQNRYHDIADVRADIQKVLADPNGVFDQPAGAMEPGVKLPQMLSWASITVILLIVVGIVVWNLRSPERHVMEIEYVLPADQQFNLDQWGHSFLAVSPDGSQFVYGTTQGLYIRSVDQLGARHISGSEDNSEEPFFSPDGQWIGYYSPADRKLKKIAINGGVPRDLCNIEILPAGAHWYRDDKIVFAMFPGGIFRIPSNGGSPELLFKTDDSEASGNGGNPILPQMLPDEESVLFTNILSTDDKQITIQSLDTGESKTLFPGEGAHYFSTGHILYNETNTNNLYAVPFDLDRLEVTGGAVPLIEGMIGGNLSESGTFAYVRQPETPSQSVSEVGSADATGRTLWWVDRDGNEERILAPLKSYRLPKISPDGTKVALTIGPQFQEDIWIWDFSRGTEIKLTFNEMMDKLPIWTPNGKRIIYMRVQQETFIDICWMAANGTGEAERLCGIPNRVLMPSSISKDGKTLFIVEMSTDWENIDIGKVSMKGDGTPEILLKEEYREATPQISPDGQWMAYFSNESGNDEIYVRSFPELDKDKRKVSTDGGFSPLWSPNGKELFYLIHTDNGVAVMAVAFDTEPNFVVGKPSMLFRGNYLPGYTEGPGYDIDPKGERFLMIKPPLTTGGVSTAEGPRKIIIVTNWFEELKEKVPVD